MLADRFESVTLRSANCSQFTRRAVRQYLRAKGMYQDFCWTATPQDNAYMEALHSSLLQEVIVRLELESLEDAYQVIRRYYQWHNEKRKHWSVIKKTPEQAWNNFFIHPL